MDWEGTLHPQSAEEKKNIHENTDNPNFSGRILSAFIYEDILVYVDADNTHSRTSTPTDNMIKKGSLFVE